MRSEEDQPVPGGPRRASAMRLAAEVARLEAELAAAQARVTELELRADSDPLTGLVNRRGFDRELRRVLAYLGRYQASAALIYLDLDGFKPINDRYGHAVGDRMLQAVAGTLASNLRGSDVVARLGGDEFIALLWNLSAGQAQAKAAALEQAVAATVIEHVELDLSVGVSAGVVMLDPAEEPEQAIARADAAMYARKGMRRAAKAGTP